MFKIGQNDLTPPQTNKGRDHFKQLFWTGEKDVWVGRLTRKTAEWTKGEEAKHSRLTVLKFQVLLKESLFLRLIVL